MDGSGHAKHYMQTWKTLLAFKRPWWQAWLLIGSLQPQNSHTEEFATPKKKKENSINATCRRFRLKVLSGGRLRGKAAIIASLRR